MNSQDGIQATEADIVIDNGINLSKKYEPISTINMQINGVMSMRVRVKESILFSSWMWHHAGRPTTGHCIGNYRDEYNLIAGDRP